MRVRPAQRKIPLFLNQLRPPTDPVSFTISTQFYISQIRTSQSPFPNMQNIPRKFPRCSFRLHYFNYPLRYEPSQIKTGKQYSAQKDSCKPFSQQITVLIPANPQPHCHQRLQYSLPNQIRSTYKSCRIQNIEDLHSSHP